MNSGENASDTTTATETSEMKTETMMNETSEELKIPYVLLERCSSEEINSYKPRTERNSFGLFSSYVLLERLSPNVIQNFLTKKDEEYMDFHQIEEDE